MYRTSTFIHRVYLNFIKFWWFLSSNWFDSSKSFQNHSGRNVFQVTTLFFRLAQDSLKHPYRFPINYNTKTVYSQTSLMQTLRGPYEVSALNGLNLERNVRLLLSIVPVNNALSELRGCPSRGGCTAVYGLYRYVPL